MEKQIKIAYIGGGSKNWARVFMNDLAVSTGLSGEIALYDIDVMSAKRNAKIGEYINKSPLANSKFDYKVYENIDEALENATFVIISILPGTFDEMESDVHAPEKYGVYQSVGDSTGAGGVLRAMRTVPIFEDFARHIKKSCPNAWVINLTNPMTILVKTLYDVYPEIKAFGCCHEVFHAQDFLTLCLKEVKGIDVDRKDIYTDACGINHFTWITKAYYQDIDLLSLLPEFKEQYFEEGYCETKNKDRFYFKENCFHCGNKVKMDLFTKYGILPAAGDRHLVEFLPHSLYLKDPETVNNWFFQLTTVPFRKEEQVKQIKETIDLAGGIKQVEVKKSSEEAVELMKAILGFETKVSNVNMPNIGQMPQLPLGSVVETNCVFSNNQVNPVIAGLLPKKVLDLVKANSDNVDLCYEGIKNRDLNTIFDSFSKQVSIKDLGIKQKRELFKDMCLNTRKYLDPFFKLDEYFNK